MSKIICNTCIYAEGSKCKKLLVPALANKCMHHTRMFKVFGLRIYVKKPRKRLGYTSKIKEEE